VYFHCFKYFDKYTCCFFVVAGSENNNIMFVPLMIHVRKHCNIFFQQHTMIADDSLFAKQCNLDKKVNCFSQ